MNKTRLPRCLVFTALILLLSSSGARGVIDLDADGVGDIWRLNFNAAALSGSADTDGDGFSNAKEAVAGTNPNLPSDVIKVSQLTIDGAGVHLTWPSLIGKRYQVQSSTTLGVSVTWTNVGVALAGTGANLTAVVPNPTQATFYRISVLDTDSDGDGVTDWEEIASGLDPENSHSNGLSQSGDLPFLTTALQAASVVTIEAPPASVGESSLIPATFTVHRTGGIKPITVHYTVSGTATSVSDFTALSGTVTIPLATKSATIDVAPKTDALVESPEAVILTVSADATYTVGSPAVAALLITDATSANGTGLSAQFWNEVSAAGPNQISDTNPAKFAGSPVVSRVDATVNYSWANGTVQGTDSPAAGVTVDYFSCRWSGEVLPEFAQIYTFYFDVNRAGRVWVNGQLLINNWPGGAAAVGSAEYNGTIALEAGVRYPIVVEQYDTTGTAKAVLSWASTNQAKQVIPQARLFASVAPQILSSLDVLTFIGGPAFSYTITASGNPTTFSAANLPPGLTLTAATGVISGVPTTPGVWQVPITATNAVGSGAAVLTISVLQAGGGISREVWNGVNGNTVALIPTGTNPSATSTLSSLQGPANAADNYGARIRGTVTAPTTGVYQFWLAADEAAQLFISDDDEPVNAWKRAEVLYSVTPMAALDWSRAVKTPLLYLKAGSRYYVEILHKEATGNDHVAVGWLKPGQTGTVPSEVVPGYLLTQYTPPAPVNGTSTLYTANLTAQGTAVTGGYGSSSLQVSADKTQAVLRYNYSNLTTPVTGKHIHSGTDAGLIIYDIDVATPNADGSYTWNIGPVAGVSDKDADGDSDAADVIKIIENGDAYLNVHTSQYPTGEVKGFHRLQTGSQTFTAPAAPPAWTDDHTDPNAAARFLQQATFGAASTDIAAVQNLGYDGWITDQFTKVASYHFPIVDANKNITNPASPTYSTANATNAWWQRSVTAPDQLRQRVAFALDQILVTSTSGPLEDRGDTVSDYYDALLDGAFDNFRNILETVTLHPAMGRYLDMLKNDKPDKATGRIPNENYAREIMQLFSIGLNRLHPDGSLMLNSKGLPIPTYDQDAIIGFAHVFTGWSYHVNGTPFPTTLNSAANWVDPMTEVPVRHYIGQKRLLNNVVLPGLTQLTNNGTVYPLNPDATYSGASGNNQIIREDDEFQGLPAQELDAAHDALFNHPNCGPFICRQLIQRLVTSTPSRGYIYRVVSKFNDNGSGVRGDMKVVIRTILLDYEARSSTARAAIGYGKQREPLLRITQAARAFPAPAPVAGTYVQTNGFITVTTGNPHRLVSGQTHTLAFSNPPLGGSPATDGTYAVTSSQPITANQYSVRAKDVYDGTYTQVAGSNILTVTTPNNHGLVTGDVAFFKFTSGSPQPADGTFAVAFSSNTQFTVTMPTAVARTGNVTLAYLKGSYRMVAPVSPATTNDVTITTTTVHGLATNASVTLNLIPRSGQTTQPANGPYTITVIDATNFKFTATYPVGSVGTLDGTFTAGCATHPLSHTGNVSTGFSNWTMGITDTELAQTPLRSPTVFNYFQPDYQFPGEMAVAGLTTPEFQLTSETNVIRQANFLYNGLFNPNNSTGLASFKTGDGKIALDINSWMGLRPGGSGYWTDNTPASSTNDNLRNLIRQLSTLLMAGQMSTAMEDQIYTQVINTTNLPYNSASGSFETHRRDRVRAVVHFILTSPDYTIQK